MSARCPGCDNRLHCCHCAECPVFCTMMPENELQAMRDERARIAKVVDEIRDVATRSREEGDPPGSEAIKYILHVLATPAPRADTTTKESK